MVTYVISIYRFHMMLYPLSGYDAARQLMVVGGCS